MSGMKRILITGGAGFIGFHLASHLSQDAANSVVLIDNFARGKQDQDLASLASHSNVHLISGDLTQPEIFNQLEGQFDEVYHLAAILGVENVIQRPQDVIRVNILATLNLLDWFTRGGGVKLLFSSTSEVYAWTQEFFPLPIPTPEDVPLALTRLDNPRSTYAGSKILGELAVTQYCNIYQKSFVIVRYHNVYGPRMGWEHVIPQLFQRASSGENPLTVYSARHSRAFCYISDAVRATVLAMRQEVASGQTINIGNDREEIDILTLARHILDIAKINAEIEPKQNLNDPIARRCPNVTRARNILGYEPQVSLENGLALTLDWYSKHLS